MSYTNLSATTPAEVMRAIELVRAIADAIRDLTKASGGVASGELYAFLIGHGMTIETYNKIIAILKESGRVEEKAHWLKWREIEEA